MIPARPISLVRSPDTATALHDVAASRKARASGVPAGKTLNTRAPSTHAGRTDITAGEPTSADAPATPPPVTTVALRSRRARSIPTPSPTSSAARAIAAAARGRRDGVAAVRTAVSSPTTRSCHDAR